MTAVDRNPFNVHPSSPAEIAAYERGETIHPEDMKHDRRFIIGVDLGKTHDHTAAVLLERGGVWGDRIHVRGVRRFPTGMEYTEQSSHLGAMANTDPLGGYRDTHMAVDATGVGVAVVEMLRTAVPCGLSPIVITSGTVGSVSDRGWQRVPKRDLIALSQVALQQHVLDFAANLADYELLTTELAAYRVKVSTAGNDSYANDAREAEHDDIVLGLAIGVWCAYRHGWGREYLTGGNRSHRYAEAMALEADPQMMSDLWAADMPASASKATRRPPGVVEPGNAEWWRSR